MEITNKKSGIMFKVTSLLSFKQIIKPGKYLLDTFSTVTDANFIAGEDGKSDKHILTVRAIAKDKLAQVAEVFKGKQEVEIEETNGLFMTASIWRGPLPMKGEKVECVVDYVDNADKTDRVLRVTGIRVIAAQVAESLNLESILSLEPIEKVGAESNELVHN